MGVLRLIVALALVISASACTQKLWRGPEGNPCNILLVNEFGGVRVESGSRVDVTSATTGDPGVSIETANRNGQTTYTVTRSNDMTTGDVSLTAPAHCSIAVKTTDGRVTVDAGPESFPLEVDTVTGGITLQINPGADAEIHLSTSGEITSDYTIGVEFKYHEEPAKHGRVAIGSGSQSSTANGSTILRLKSLRGSISVLRPAVGSEGP